MARIIEFEGRHVEVPDDASDDEVSQILSPPAASTATTPATTPAAAPSLVSKIMSGADSALGTAAYAPRGVRKGLANLVGLPVDAVNAGMSLFGGGSDKPFLGSKHLDEVLNAPARAASGIANMFGADTRPDLPAPVGPMQNILSRTGEEIGAAAVPVGAAIRAGSMGVDAARKLPLLARMFVEPAAINPAGFAVKEAGTAAAAGMGAGLINTVTPEKGVIHDVGDIGGALAGAGMLGATKIAARPIGDIFNAIFRSGKFSNDVVKSEVVDRIANNATTLPRKPGESIDTQPLVEAINGGPRVSDTVPGFTESLADRTGDAGLASLEYGRQSGGNAKLFANQRTENAAAVDNAIAANGPTGTPGALRSELELERNRRLTDAQVQHLDAEDAATRAVAPLTPTDTPAARGNTIRTGLEDSREAARAQTEDAYARADVADHPADPAELARTIDDSLAGMTEVERGLVPQGTVERVRRLGEPNPDVDTGVLGPDGQPIMRPGDPLDDVRLKEATDLRSELQRLGRAALADPKAEKGGRNAARVIGRLSDAVEGYIERTLPADQYGQLVEARGAKFNEAEHFTRAGDPVAAALARHEGGQPRMTDERVAGSFVNNQAMDRLLTEADTPQVRRAIRDEVLSRADTTHPERLREFAGTYGPQIDRFPGLRAEIDTAIGAREAETAAAGRSRATVAELGTPNSKGTSTTAKYLEYGEERAQDAMKGVMANKNPSKAADELLTFVNDEPAAVEGARKAFWDIMEQRSRSAGETTRTMDGTQPWMPRRLKAFLDDPATAAVAERLYRDNPEHLANVRQIADVLQGVDLRSRAKAPNTSGTAQGNSAILSPETLQSRFYAYKRGQTSLGFMVTALASVVARRAVRGAQGEAIEKLLDQALLNPELAATLLKENNPANRAAMARTSKAFLGNEASTVADLIKGEDKNSDPVKDAAMKESAKPKRDRSAEDLIMQGGTP